MIILSFQYFQSDLSYQHVSIFMSFQHLKQRARHNSEFPGSVQLPPALVYSLLLATVYQWFCPRPERIKPGSRPSDLSPTMAYKENKRKGNSHSFLLMQETHDSVNCVNVSNKYRRHLWGLTAAWCPPIPTRPLAASICPPFSALDFQGSVCVPITNLCRGLSA